MLALLGEAPDFALAVIHFLARRLQHVTSLLEEVTLFTTRERAARYVLRQAAGEATRPLVQTEIASLIGTTREGVARALRALETDGAIELRHGRGARSPPLGADCRRLPAWKVTIVTATADSRGDDRM
jgi:CRP-like cAMP-binding protein